MKKQEIINQANQDYLKLLFSNTDVINNFKAPQKAIELTEGPYATLHEADDLTTFNNAVRLFYKRVEAAYDVIKMYSKK